MNARLLLANATLFSHLARMTDNGLFKISYIRRMPKGYWGVFSHKGRLLGKYKTKGEAAARLRQIEFFKHKKASKDESVTYSSLMREINHNYGPDLLREFQQVFKKYFDQALLDGETKPDEIALQAGLKWYAALQKDDRKIASFVSLIKTADTELGSPEAVGLYLSNLIKFILRKISDKNRHKSIQNLRHKLFHLNENEISSKWMPPAASIGQSLVIVKHLLFGKDPRYIRQVLNSIVSNL